MRDPFETMPVPDSAFAQLLLAFNAEGRAAAREFAQRRAKLIYVLHGLGCANAADLADEVFARVEKKLAEGVVIHNLEAYLLTVARNVALEDGKHARMKPAPLDGVEQSVLPYEDPEQIARERATLTRERQRMRCMKRCWRRLPEAERKKFTDYFFAEGRERIARRKQLAHALSLSSEALRVEIHRKRAALEECVRVCYAQRRIGL